MKKKLFFSTSSNSSVALKKKEKKLKTRNVKGDIGIFFRALKMTDV
jgi:hypothetical protein